MSRMRLTGTLCLIAGGVALVVGVAFAYDLFTRWPANSSESELATCQAQVTDGIGLALRSWAQDHHGRFSFNVSTNEGGTRELGLRTWAIDHVGQFLLS